MKNLTKQNLTEVFSNAADALKAVSRDRIASKTRIAIWNTFFPESPLYISTSLRHILYTTFIQYISGGPTDRFCFELSVLFFDLPIHFYELTIIFPVPLSIAMRDAYKVVNSHLQMPNQESMKKLITCIVETLPKEKLPKFKAILQSIFWDKSEIDTYIDLMKKLLEPICFDAFLEAMPPTSRLRYALRYNRSPPKVSIDYHKIEMPIEFIQAIAEMDGCPEARKLSFTNDLEEILKLSDNEPPKNPFSDEDYSISISDDNSVKTNLPIIPIEVRIPTEDKIPIEVRIPTENKIPIEVRIPNEDKIPIENKIPFEETTNHDNNMNNQ